ncbi:hypothetical protein [Rhodococcus sp. NPDC004095]
MQESLFTAAPQPEKRPIPRTKAGEVKASDLKAIQWYKLQHGLKLVAPAAFPTYRFKTSDGEELEVHLSDIQDEYREFRQSTYGKRQAA